MSTEDAERLANLAIESFQLKLTASSKAKISDGYSSHPVRRWWFSFRFFESHPRKIPRTRRSE
jgi:hypothetical protein